VERFSFAPEAAFVPPGDLLDHVSVAPLTSPFEEGALVQAAIFRFEPGGRLRRHPATFPQIFAILEGSGEVSGTNGVDDLIGADEAVFLHEGEDHGMKSEAGLTVLILQGANLDRFRARPKPAA
jgi:quercetin dioxygenase-like cupin family protein